MINREHAEGDIDSKRLEEGGEVLLDFNKLSSVAGTGQAVLPVVVQDARSGEVLILAYANEQALRYTLENGIAAFWSTSRNTLWVKGKTSGDTLKIVEVRVNCEQNSLLYRVRLEGKGSCHTKNKAGDTRLGCYYRVIREDRLESLDP
jgi:phosphoribosyl-AMP cyclohydrolase